MTPTNVYFLLIVILALINNVSSKSLNELPLFINKGNLIIDAALTDSATGQKYSIREYISSGDIIRGRISVSWDKRSADIFYNSKSNADRLVIHENDCEWFKYNVNWNKQLLGAKNALINDVLMVGPSLIYRLRGLNFQIQNQTVTLHGVLMNVAKATIFDQLNAIYYYRATSDIISDTIKPRRVELIGHEVFHKSTIVLEIFSITKTDQQLDKVVTPTPGIGCPIYLSNGLPSVVTFTRPLLVGNRREVHYVETVEIRNSGWTKSSEKKEVYFSETNIMANFKTWTDDGFKEAVYDYKLGLIYTFNDDECSITPMNTKTVGINDYGHISLETLLQIELYDEYVGQVFFEQRSGFIVDVYESFKHNGTINGRRYDKVVKTFYYAPSGDKYHSKEYRDLLVGITYNGYMEGKLGGYDLIETTKRDFYDFKTRGLGAELYETNLKLDTCYPDPTKHVTLAIYIKSEDVKNFELAKRELTSFRDEFKYQISSAGVSMARLSKIDFVFEDKQIIAYTTFLPFPPIETAFRLEQKYLDLNKSFKEKLSLINLEECFARMGQRLSKVSAVIFCPQKDGNDICAQAKELSDLKEAPSGGTKCNIWYTPLNNLRTYVEELPLELLADTYNQRRLQFSIYDDQNSNSIAYEITHAVLVEHSDSIKGFKFRSIIDHHKLPNNQHVQIVTDVVKPNDCYKSCAHDDTCETFSYCEINGKITCLRSNLGYGTSIPLESSSGCKVIFKDRLAEYVKIPNRAFIDSPSKARTMPIGDCASNCFASDDCFSFQDCGNSCTFAGTYTDAGTKSSEKCDIYVPKVTHKYQATGKRIISEVFATEINLTLDQCAALCYDQRNNSELCKSYNYCPKGLGRSTCQLTKYSVKETSMNVTDSETCQNYELVSSKSSSNKNEQNNNPSAGLTRIESKGSVFGIIMLFCASGFILGAVVPYIVRASRQLISKRYPSTEPSFTFGWSKQLDAQ